MILIKKITFRNFKLFGPEDYSISFENSDLVLMDGPNGYGKTSVFDALELALTGNIDRLIPLENRQIPNDVVVARNSAADVEIQLELSGESGISILRKLKNPLPKDARKISKFQELWDTFEKSDGKWVNINRDELNKRLKNRNFARDYHLFHYIQQEESARFLKTNNETQRAEALAGLFGDTKAAEVKLGKLLALHKKIESSRLELFRQIGSLKTSSNLQKIERSDPEVRIEQHQYLLPWLSQVDRPEWDQVNFDNLGQKKLNDFLEELSHLNNFVKFKSDFLKDRVYVRSSQQIDLLRAYIKYYGVLSDVDRYADLHMRGRFLRQSLLILSQGDTESIARLDVTALFLSINLGEPTEFLERLNELIAAEKENVGSNFEYGELIKNRDLLLPYVHQITGNCDCPLCGQRYDSHGILISYVLEHGQLLRSLLDGQQRRLVVMRDSFRQRHLTTLIAQITEDFSRSYYPSDDELAELVSAQQLADRLRRLDGWLVAERVVTDNLVEKRLPFTRNSGEIEDVVGLLAARIRKNSPVQSEAFNEANTDGGFGRIYRNFFLNDASLVESFNGDNIGRKSAYLKSQYSRSIDSTLKNLRESEERLEKLLRKKEQLAEIISIVRSQINQYRKRLITDIEIPFFIYSGKILQTHQVGIGHGIFIKDPTGGDELRNVRFVANLGSDHDVLNTMSSGQISAVVISLALALNKVYSGKFKPILIDDPVQTMDDINMSSLVELLRNDFADRQIILSTHEEKVSRYFIYKFLKYNKSVRIVDLMLRKEHVPANKYVYEHSSIVSSVNSTPS